MRSFFTSSLDNFDPPSPFVNAMSWDSYRTQFQSTKRSKSGNRNCGLASGSLNPESAELTDSTCSEQDISLIIQNTVGCRYRIEVQPEPESLPADAVDACFGAANIEFLSEKTGSANRTKACEDSIWSSGNSHDLELGILESVQEIAMALVRTTPNRTAPASEEIGSYVGSNV